MVFSKQTDSSFVLAQRRHRRGVVGDSSFLLAQRRHRRGVVGDERYELFVELRHVLVSLRPDVALDVVVLDVDQRLQGQWRMTSTLEGHRLLVHQYGQDGVTDTDLIAQTQLSVRHSKLHASKQRADIDLYS